jgi:putative transposase
MAIEEVKTAPRSPWQNPYCERLIGSIRRECTDHVIVFNEQHLRHVLDQYVAYERGARTHQSLDDDCPEPRAIEPPEMGQIIALAQGGGLHHRYSRRLAA